MDAFEALADPVRRALLTSLVGGPARVVDLAAEHPVSRPAVSKHLRLLTAAGLTTVADHGRERHYALASSGLRPVLDLLADLRPARPFDERALDGLDLEVRRTSREHRVAAAQRSEEDIA